MARTRAALTVYDKNRCPKDMSRMGSDAAYAKVMTLHSDNSGNTSAAAYVEADGNGYVQVVRNGEIIHRFEFEAE